MMCLLVTYGAACLLESLELDPARGCPALHLPHPAPFSVMATSLTILIAYWNPLNFLAYPFAAILIHRYQDHIFAGRRNPRLTVIGLLVSTALAAWYEWTYHNQGVFLVEGPALPLLMRTSLVFFGAAIILVVMLPWRESPALIRFMSKYSLALFVLHAFFRLDCPAEHACPGVGPTRSCACSNCWR